MDSSLENKVGPLNPKQTQAPPCVVLARPMVEEDPCLIRAKGMFVFKEVLCELVLQKIVSQVILAVPHYIPDHIKNILEQWDRITLFCGDDAPQRRLHQVFMQNDFQEALILTSYSIILDGNKIQSSSAHVRAGISDAIFSENAVAAAWFGVMNRSAVKGLSKTDSHVLPPFLFKEHLKRNGAKVSGIDDAPGSLVGQFILETFSAGERAMIPKDLLNRFLLNTDRKDWFHPNTFFSMVEGLVERDGRFSFQGVLQRLGPKVITQMAAQVNFIRLLKGHLPRNGDCFLEIGCGEFPLLSAFMINQFKRGMAVEPNVGSKSNRALAFDLCRSLSRYSPRLIPCDTSKTSESDNSFDRIEFFDKKIEALGIESESVDFCFSRVVLEHVENVKSLSGEIHRILKPGAAMIHRIDLRDHGEEGDDVYVNFDFLKYSKTQWRTLNRGTNLWRINDYVDLWSSMGFDVQVLHRNSRIMENGPLHECWRPYRTVDLYCYDALIKAVKPA